ncbi:hypothetical protein LTR37_017871 [Vermiconidia calcicola]|uniref:Uncharacterized protein n=1 Tax=Vermiconidia calcicola TaxID=1690605 RepID=A0ACC3MIV8_9PEZI|nr:hypothetical protein LTR37_017871 [Vermiconidia calcicola]
MAHARVFTRREIESLIAAGDIIVITQNTVLRLNAWKDKHPGGSLVLQHMIGRDATHEINISHSPEIVKSMRHYRIGRVDGVWENLIPPIQGGVYHLHAKEEHTHKPTSSPHDSAYESDGSSDCVDITELEWENIKEVSKNMPHRTNAGVQRHNTERDAQSLMSPEDYTTAEMQQALENDLAKYPSLDAATQGDIAAKFQLLHQRVRDEGFYDCRYVEYYKEMARYATLFALFAFCLSRSWYFVSACFLGLFWHQIMFSAHDAGHRGITHNFTKDTLIGIFIADFCCGLSIGWWKSSHNVHHLVPNLPEHDPDIQNVPLFATSPSFFNSVKSSYYGTYFPWDAAAGVAIKYQKYTYYPVMALARFNLYVLSWLHLAKPHARAKGTTWWTWYVELTGISFYTFWYFYVILYRSIDTWQSRAIFLLTSHLVTMPLHVQITLSHWGTSTSDLGPAESFAQRQLRTTMDVECPKWLDFIHGGLQFQAVHHLFPRVPRHNLRRLQELVKEFCAETKIEYLIHGFAEGNCVVLNKLQDVANQAKILAACQTYMAETGHYDLE